MVTTMAALSHLNEYEFYVISDDIEWEKMTIIELKKRRPGIRCISRNEWIPGKYNLENLIEPINNCKKVVVGFAPSSLTGNPEYLAQAVVQQMLCNNNINEGKLIPVRISEDATIPPYLRVLTPANSWEPNVYEKLLRALDGENIKLQVCNNVDDACSSVLHHLKKLFEKNEEEGKNMVKVITELLSNKQLELQYARDGSIIFYLNVNDPKALKDLWKIHLNGQLIKDLANILIPEDLQEEFLKKWTTKIDETEYLFVLDKFNEKKSQVATSIEHHGIQHSPKTSKNYNMAEKDLQQSMNKSDKCSICLENCEELKTLNCQHSFCLCCLQDWMKKKGELECPNCRQIHPDVPEGGLIELPPNTTEVLTAESVGRNNGSIKCCCGQYTADHYCQECSQYLCTSCKNTHEKLPALHTLQTINANWPPSAEAQEKPLCQLHEKEFEFYCNDCKTPICQKCTITDHSEDKGKHKPIRVSEAFDNLKLTAKKLMVRANFYKQQAEAGIDNCTVNVNELSESRNDILTDINNTVTEIITLVRAKATALEKKLENTYEAKKGKSNTQIDELKSMVSDVERKQDNIKELLKSGEATALKTCQMAIGELQDKIAVLPQTKPRDDGKIYFFGKKCTILGYLDKQEIGSVSEKPNENIFKIITKNPLIVTSYQEFHVEITQLYKCEIDIKDLTVSEKERRQYLDPTKCFPTINIVKSNGKYIVIGTTSKDMILDVKFCNSSIKGSPIKIVVESVGIVGCIKNVGQSTGTMKTYSNYRDTLSKGTRRLYRNTDMPEVNKSIQDILISGNGWFLVACNTHEVFKFEMTGAFMSTITLSPTSKVQSICKLKNNNLIFCDRGNSNITICKQNGCVIKSITTCPATKATGLQTLSYLSGIDVDEDLHLVYVADQAQHCVMVFNLESNRKVRTIGSKGGLEGQLNRPSDVAVTKEGNLIVADTHNHRLQLFVIYISDGQFIEVLICGGDEDGMVINPTRVCVDYDNNIIVACTGKVQLFNKCGKFLRVIHRNEKEETNDFAFSIVSDFPRRLALAEVNSITLSIINY